MEKVFMEKELETVLNNFITKYFDEDISTKSFISNIDEINKKIKTAVNGLSSTSQLLSCYQAKTDLMNKDVERIIGIKDYGSFKKSETFNKKTLCLLSICFHLNELEVNELLLSASIKLDPIHSIYDCVYVFYIKNYNVVKDPELNVAEFQRCLVHAENYLSEKILQRGA